MSAQHPGLHLADLTWPEAAERLRAHPVGLLPIGATEEHGPHLPLDTDVIIASATAEWAAARLARVNVPALILPPLVYTVSFVGTSFPGTSPADAAPFGAYLTSVLTHLAPQGYRALVLCNAHLEPAHFDTLQASCRAAEAASGVPTRCPDQRFAPHNARLSDEFRAGARHAGSYETSIVLAAEPEAVRGDALRGLPPVWIDLPARLAEGARTFAEAGSELGYFGNPALATAEEGRQMLAALADMIVATCAEAGVLKSS